MGLFLQKQTVYDRKQSHITKHVTLLKLMWYNVRLFG